MSEERYEFDHHTIARTRFPLRTVELLVDKIEDERWHRERLCNHCEGWTPSEGADKRPIRPGNPHPTEGCLGCWYAMLDPGERYRAPNPDTQTPPRRRYFRELRIVSYLGPDNIRFTNGKGLEVDRVNLEQSY